MKRTVIFFTLLGLSLAGAHAAPPQPLILQKTITLDNVDGKLDHLWADPQSERLYLAAVTKDSLEVVDLKLGKLSRSVPGPRGPQGIAVIPDTRDIVVTSSEDGVCRLYNPTLNLVRFINELPDADNVRYDTGTKRLYIACKNAIAVIDPTIPAKVAEITLDDSPESFQVEQQGSSIYANLPGIRQIAVVDKNTCHVTATWTLQQASDNFPMALDERNHRLFVGCRQPATVLVYDTNYGSYVGKIDCTGDADDIYYDDVRKLLYVSGGQGFVSVIGMSDPYLYKPIATVPTAPGARTSYFDTESGTLYVAAPERKRQPAAILVFKAQP